MFPVLDMYYADPAQPLPMATDELDDLDDLDYLYDLCEVCMVPPNTGAIMAPVQAPRPLDALLIFSVAACAHDGPCSSTTSAGRAEANSLLMALHKRSYYTSRFVAKTHIKYKTVPSAEIK